MRKTWVVVVDERDALVYEAAARKSIPFELKHTLKNDADGPDRDLESDRPGRAFSSSTGQRHGIDGERSTRRSLQEAFGRQVAAFVDHGRQKGAFRQLVIVAGARMLGLLRAALPDASRNLVVAEITKDMVHHDEPKIRALVPRETWLPRLDFR